ncbi:MAG: DUF2851 family protein [Saprospiraceae bacterium]|nr:DUF2851 family protein [Saprospiraceae bacterium]
MTSSPIKEDFLHYLWRIKKVPAALETTDGRAVEILEFGVYNLDSGPDFFNAKIKLEDTVWVGNIEMHVFTSDWKKHGHQHDKAYDNVILHVVYEDDQSDSVKIANEAIPTLALKAKIPKIYLDNYLTLVQSINDIPCKNMISSVPSDKINLWKYTLSIERLHNKSITVTEILKTTNYDWEETLYIMLARYFGAKVNIEPFEMLARSLPLSIINKNKDKRETLDALIFGQAGMLMANYEDDYFLSLKKEFHYQQKKYNIKPIDAVAWKFSKLRPMNFPTVRLAQFAGLLYRVTFLFSQIKETDDINEIKKMLYSQASPYWEDHYRFGTLSTASIAKQTSSDFIDILLINAVSPVLYTYGLINDEQKYIEKAIQILENTTGETNTITKLWKSLGVTTKTAFDTQALIHLKHNYCHEHKCLSCKIGHEIMGR